MNRLINLDTRVSWSVMIPTYNPSDFLRATITDVLSQGYDSDRMEIVVVDDASPHVDTTALVQDIAGDRVRCIVHKENKKLAGNWNFCVSEARGEFIHILHQDDRVYPGYYATMERLFAENPKCAAAFCRHEIIDHHDGRLDVSILEQEYHGIIKDFKNRIFVSQRIQCPSISVKKSVYEELGLFCGNLKYSLDWDMWKRISAQKDIAYSPEILAAYRVHAESETNRLKQMNICFNDHINSIKISESYLPQSESRLLRRKAEIFAYQTEVNLGWQSLANGDTVHARRKSIKALLNGYINLEVLKLFLCSLRGY